MNETSPLLFLIHLSGAAALLLWSVRLVRTGVERGWNLQMRRLLRRGADNRWIAAAIGAAAAVLLQSSTAVALLTTNFVASATLLPVQALATILGADVGSAIVAQLLTSRAFWLVPILLIAGVFLFLKGQQRNARMVGRILIGLALVFVALSMLRDATEPLRQSPTLVAAMKYLAGDPMTAFVIGAGLAWIMYSSVAAILLFVTFTAQDLLPVNAGVAMVLGANLGGAAIAFTLTMGADLSARRVIFANLILRGSGALVTLVMITLFVPSLTMIGAAPAKQLLNLHLLFNVGLLIITLPFIGPIMRAANVWLREPAGQSGAERISALDPSALARPEHALACATREMLMMGEIVTSMLRSVIRLYDQWNDELAAKIKTQESDFNRMHLGIKIFLAKVQQQSDAETINQRVLNLAEMASSLGGAGHSIAQSMVSLARRLDLAGTRFSTMGMAEIRDLHDRIVANAQTSLNVLMTQDPEVARILVEEKDYIRDYEQQLQHSHLDRIKDGLTESIETSTVHQETLRALKQINSAFTMVTYPILAESGELLPSRLNKYMR